MHSIAGLDITGMVTTARILWKTSECWHYRSDYLKVQMGDCHVVV